MSNIEEYLSQNIYSGHHKNFLQKKILEKTKVLNIEVKDVLFRDIKHRKPVLSSTVTTLKVQGAVNDENLEETGLKLIGYERDGEYKRLQVRPLRNIYK